MTNPDAFGLISTTTDVVQATAGDYSLVKDDKALQHAFHESGRDLLVVKEALHTARNQIQSRGLAGQSQVFMKSLKACNEKALLSRRIFENVARSPEIKRAECYRAAVRQAGQGNTVEALVEGMMKDVCELAKSCTSDAAMKKQVQALRDAIGRLSTIEPSVEASRNYFNNYGSGHQYNNPGGTQNNNTGSGTMLEGAIFHGPVNFGK
jgi:maltooligosyltrehalose synthase